MFMVVGREEGTINKSQTYTRAHSCRHLRNHDESFLIMTLRQHLICRGEMRQLYLGGSRASHSLSYG